MYDIITFGSATQDVFMSSGEFQVVKDERFVTKKGLCVPLGSKMHMEQVFFAMGGNGANTACTFAEQGLKTAYFGQIGRDLSGKGIKDELSKHNVSLEFVKEVSEHPTSYSVILSLPGVGRTILEQLGASRQLSEKDINFDKLKAKWFLVSSMSGNSSKTFEPLIDFAHTHKIKVVVTPGKTQLTKDLDVLRSLLEKIDILILNQEEAAQIVDLDFSKEKEIFKKLNSLVRGMVVMTKGPEGVIVSDGKKIYSAGIPESGMIDRTGAGDAFSSAFVAGWIEKGNITHAIQLGTANATSVLQKMGATNGLLKKTEWGKWKKVKVNLLGNQVSK